MTKNSWLCKTIYEGCTDIKKQYSECYTFWVSSKNSNNKNKPVVQENNAVLMVEEPKKSVQAQKNSEQQQKETEEQKAKIKLGSLNKIRDQIKNQNNEKVSIKSLSSETINESWELFIQKLNDQKNHSAATNFKMARLEIIDENTIEIIVESNIQQKFVESERAGLTDHLQKYFNNKMLKYRINLIEKEILEEDQPKVLNTKEHFSILSQQYPLIKVLKEKLRLEL